MCHGRVGEVISVSLVSCPIYLSPATARTKPIRLHQVWQATPPSGAGEPLTQPSERDVTELRAPRPHSDQVEERAEPVSPASRIMLLDARGRCFYPCAAAATSGRKKA
jgi:hypothetical protein